MPFHSINPATGERFATFDRHNQRTVDERLSAAADAARAWRRVPVGERAALLNRVARELDAGRDDFAAAATGEMGKTLRAARDEVAKCALACHHFATTGPSLLAPQDVRFDAGVRAAVRSDPIGVLLAIMPWNFPFWQVIRAAAPAIVAGNGVVLKHASNVPKCARLLETIFQRAGAPRGLFSALLIHGDEVGDVIADPRIAAVTLTGSEAAGRDVAARAGAALKKSVLELGGSDPFIVRPSADVPAAAAAAVASRIVNNGQSCIAAKRFIVDESIAAEFTRHFVDRMRGLAIGDPTDDATDLGPLSSAAARDDLHEQVLATVAKGAKVLTGGNPRNGPGFYYEPTVLADVPEDAGAARDELFGPVAPIFVVPDADAALELANATDFGLGASVWTADPAEADYFTKYIEAGLVFVNGVVTSDPRLPFGGVKHSGYGRELGVEGLREFVNIKSVVSRGLSPD